MHSLFAGTSIRICRDYHQNLLQVITSSLEGKKQYIFQTKFFPLEFEGISYNSVFYKKKSCDHLISPLKRPRQLSKIAMCQFALRKVKLTATLSAPIPDRKPNGCNFCYRQIFRESFQPQTPQPNRCHDKSHIF